MKHFILNIIPIILIVLSCDRNTPDNNIPQDVSIVFENTHGIAIKSGSISRIPSVYLKLSTTKDSWDFDRLRIDYTVNGKDATPAYGFLDPETHILRKILISEYNYEEFIRRPFFGRYHIEGTIRAEDPMSTFPEQSFSDDLWVDTGVETSYSFLIGTREGRHDLEKEMPALADNITDTLIVTYSPSDSYFEVDGELTFEGTDTEALKVSVKEKDWDGIIKVPFKVPGGAKSVELILKAENACGKKEISKTVSCTRTGNYIEFDAVVPATVYANNSIEVPLTITATPERTYECEFVLLSDDEDESGQIIGGIPFSLDDQTQNIAIPVDIPLVPEGDYILSIIVRDSDFRDEVSYEKKFGIQVEWIPVESISLYENNVQISNNYVLKNTDGSASETHRIKIKYFPENASYKNVRASSMNKALLDVSVSADGSELSLTRKSVGETYLIVNPFNYEGMEYTYKLKLIQYCPFSFSSEDQDSVGNLDGEVHVPGYLHTQNSGSKLYMGGQFPIYVHVPKGTPTETTWYVEIGFSIGSFRSPMQENYNLFLQPSDFQGCYHIRNCNAVSDTKSINTQSTDTGKQFSFDFAEFLNTYEYYGYRTTGFQTNTMFIYNIDLYLSVTYNGTNKDYYEIVLPIDANSGNYPGWSPAISALMSRKLNLQQ